MIDENIFDEDIYEEISNEQRVAFSKDFKRIYNKWRKTYELQYLSNFNN